MTSAGKCKILVRAGKHKLGAKVGKYELGARAGAGSQVKGRGLGNTKTQTIRCCCQVHLQVASLLKKERSNFLSGYGYMRNNLARLGGYTLTDMLLICQISFIFILCLYDEVGRRTDRDQHFEAK